MPTVYACDTCHTTAESLTGWLIVSVQFIHNDPNAPMPPGGRMLDSTAPDLLFDTLECRQTWCTGAHVTDPGPIPAPMQVA